CVPSRLSSSMPCSCSLLSSLPTPAAPRTSPLSLHDALPICVGSGESDHLAPRCLWRHAEPIGSALHHQGGHRHAVELGQARLALDRKSTRLNSSHVSISYAVFCLKKKNNRSYTQGISNMPVD